jgi:hypothetical protein
MTENDQAPHDRVSHESPASDLPGHFGVARSEAPASIERPARSVLGGWALALAIAALVASFLVGWLLPLGLAAIVVAIVALRRPVESRALAVWSIALGVVAVLYSAGWLLWAAWQLGLVG